MQPNRRAGLPLLILFLVSVSAVTLGGCGDDPSPGSVGRSAIEGRTWVTDELTVDGVRSAAPSGARIELTLGTDGRLRARAGCNHMAGTYELRGDVLEVGDLSATQMGCPAELMALDATIATLLGAKPAIALVGDGLSITSAAVSLTLVDLERVEPTPPLAGTTWTLDTIITGQAASSLPQGLVEPIRLRFTDDGGYSITTGCNGLGGTFTRVGATLSVVAGPTTLIACPAPLDTLERALAKVFAGDLSAVIERQRLTLVAPGGDGFGFTASP